MLANNSISSPSSVVGRRRLEPLELLALDLELALLEPVLGEHRSVRIDDDDVLGAVDDQELVLAYQRSRIVGRDHRRHVEAAGDDRRMRGDAAEIGQERGEVVRLELDDVGRRQIVRDEYGLFLGAGRAHGSGLAQQHLEHALHYLHHIGAAFAQVRVLDVVELLDQHRHLLSEGPLRVAVQLGDHPLGRLGNRRIGEDHPMDVEKCTELGRRIA